jgi:hypothetical protein
MPRFLLFKSGPDALVANPHAIGVNPPRFAGRRMRDVPPSPKVRPEDEHPNLVDFYEPCEEVLIDHPHLRDAAKAGDGEILCVVTARTRADADKQFEAEATKRATSQAMTRTAAKAAKNEVS